MTERRAHVPEGAAVLTPYICPRDAAAAIDWYVEILGATETVDRFVDPDGRVGHAALSVGGAPLMLSDAHPDYGAVAPEPGNRTATFALSLYVPDVDATVAAAEKAGATVQRPPEDQFHGSRQASLVDPFGVRWTLGTHQREVGAAEMSRAAADFRQSGAEPGPVQP